MTPPRCCHRILELMMLLTPKRLFCIGPYAHICHSLSPVVTAAAEALKCCSHSCHTKASATLKSSQRQKGLMIRFRRK